MAQIRLALQLYTVRDHLKEDYVGTLKRVKEIGYDFVEATPPPSDAEKTKEVYDDAGLSIVDFHVSLGELEGNLDHWIDFARALGGADLVFPWMPEERRKTKEDWLANAALLEEIGARCTEAGLRLAYHNHSFEFVRFEGQYALDLLYANTTPENVRTELDTYWVKHGGADPAEYIRKYAGRGPLLHIKDMAADENRSFAEIGRGILDWPGIYAAALASGVECCIVEQDRCAGDSFDSARISFEFASELLAGR